MISGRKLGTQNQICSELEPRSASTPLNECTISRNSLGHRAEIDAESLRGIWPVPETVTEQSVDCQDCRPALERFRCSSRTGTATVSLNWHGGVRRNGRRPEIHFAEQPGRALPRNRSRSNCPRRGNLNVGFILEFQSCIGWHWILSVH